MTLKVPYSLFNQNLRAVKTALNNINNLDRSFGDNLFSAGKSH
jgi:hypothetical protein